MDIPCFLYFGKPFIASLDIKNEEKSLKVLCYERNVYTRATPEEIVRQSLLWFLINGSQYCNDWKDKLIIAVERFNIDISLSLNPDIDGFETNSIFLIIEIKNKKINLDDQDIEIQIRKYISRKNCTDCILFNAISMTYLQFEMTTQSFKKIYFNDLSEFDNLINKLIESHEDLLNRQIELFNKARNGDFESFKKLIGMYGTRCTIEFEFEKDFTPYRHHAFLFKIEGDSIQYNIRGIPTKKKQIIDKKKFRKIISIIDSAW